MEIEVTTKNPNRQRAGASNGKLGAGKHSPEGKTRSSRNSTKHAFTSEQFRILAHECASTYAQSETRHLETLQPRDEHEYLLVLSLVRARWNVERAEALSTAALNSQCTRTRSSNVELSYFLGFEALTESSRAFTNLQRYLVQHHRIARQAQADLIAYRRSNPPVDDSFDWRNLVSEPEKLEAPPTLASKDTKLRNEGKACGYAINSSNVPVKELTHDAALAHHGPIPSLSAPAHPVW